MPLFKGKILVTGGAGLIGSAVICALNQKGIDDILVTDLLGCDERWKNLSPLRFDDYVEAGNLLELLETPRLAEIKTILHLGACSATTEKNCSYLIENNFEFTRRLADWSLMGGRRFVYASSAATYGDGLAGMIDSVTDLHRYRPLNMYGYSKHLFDIHAARRGWLDRMVGLKYFNVYGPNEAHKGDMRSVVHKAFGQIQKEGKVGLFKSDHPEYRDGEQMRDFLYVKDAADATLHLAAHPSASGLFNLGSGVASTWIHLVTPIFEALGLPINIEFVDLPESLRGKYQYHTCADISRLRATGWDGPRHTLDLAVRDYVANYLLPDRHLEP